MPSDTKAQDSVTSTTIVPPSSDPELCFDLADARRLAGIVDQHPLLLERVNLLESRLRLTKNENLALRDAYTLQSGAYTHATKATDLYQLRTADLEKQVKRGKRGRWLWGVGGVLVGGLVTALAVGLTGS